MIDDPKATRGEYAKLFVVAGPWTAPARWPAGLRAQRPHGGLLNADGAPEPAAELWKLITKAGVTRYAELVLVADGPAEAAVDYCVFRLMGWPDVKAWADR